MPRKLYIIRVYYFANTLNSRYKNLQETIQWRQLKVLTIKFKILMKMRIVKNYRLQISKKIWDFEKNYGG